jgi:signal peptidase I
MRCQADAIWVTIRNAGSRRNARLKWSDAEGSGQKAVPKADVSVRTRLRDNGAGLRQDQRHDRALPLQPKGVLASHLTFMNPPTDGRHALGVELAAEVIGTFGAIRLRVTGTSMVPAVQPGDLLTVRRVLLEDISPGEIVLVARPNRLFAHRVVGNARSHEPYLVTRGDRLPHNDPPAFRSDLLGKVTSVERNGHPVASVNWLNPSDRVLSRILRLSEWATILFVRLAALRLALADERNPWQVQRPRAAAWQWSWRSGGCPSGCASTIPPS